MEYIDKDYLNDIQCQNLGLRIISTHYKKSLLPDKYEQEMFLKFLYSNINYFLDNDLIRNFKLFLSQFFLYAHNDLKKTEDNLQIYSTFLKKLYWFCYITIGTESCELGIHVLLIILNVAKGKLLCINLCFWSIIFASYE